MAEGLSEIRDLIFMHQNVVMDGKYFIGCVLKDCDLLYEGGKVMFLETAVVRCRWQFGEAAHRTINILQFFGLDVPDVPLNSPIWPN